MRFSFFILTFILSSSAFAADCRLALGEKRPLSFRNVEVFRRNNNIGQQQVGDIHFTQWFEVGSADEHVSSFIGMTSEGHVYHLIQWKDRRVARLLSGERQFKEILMRDGYTLAGLDTQDNLLFYSPSKWLLSPLKSTVKQGLAYTAVGSGAAAAVLAFFFPDLMSMGFDLGFVTAPIAPLFITSSIGFQTFFVMLMRYERLNTFPDGFVDLVSFNNKEKLREGLASHWNPPPLDSLAPRGPEAATEDHRKP